MSEMANTNVTLIDNQKRHPIGMWYMSGAYAFYTFAFGGINALLVLFLIQHVKLSSAHAYEIYAAFNSLIWTYPLLGGYLSTKFGYKEMTIAGLVICIIGIFLLSIPNIYTMYFGLAAFVVGYGISTPACFAIVGLLYDKQDSRRESGYTMFYLLFNFGFLVSVLGSGFFARYLGFLNAFFIDAIAMVLCLVTFLVFSKWIQPYEGRSMKPENAVTVSKTIVVSAIVAVISVPIISLLIKFTHLNNAILFLMLATSIVGILVIAAKQKESIAKKRLYALLLLLIISIAFWSLYMLEPSLLTVFISNNVERHIFGIFVPAASYYSLDPFFVIVLGYVFSRLWWYLSHKGKDFSIPAKITSSIVSMGLGYMMLVFGLFYVSSQHLTNSIWVVLCYMFLATAELLLAPISMSMIGRLSPEGKEGTLMGMWQVFVGFSAVLSGYLAQLAVTPKKGLPVNTNPIYSHSFLEMGLTTIIIGLIAACFVPMIKKLMKHD